MRPARRPHVVLLATVAAAAVAASTAAPAEATSTVAPTTAITVAKGAGKALRVPGLRVGATGAAWGGGRTVTVPVSGAAAGSRPTVTHAATSGLRLRAGRRSVLVRGLRADLRAGTVRATVGRRAVTVFALRDVRVATAADGTRTATASVRVSSAGARALRTALRAPRLRAGAFGTLRTLLPVPVPIPTAPLPAPAPIVLPGAAPTSAPTTPTVPTTPAPSTVEAVPGVPSLDWTVRTSWMDYLVGGGGTAEATGGAQRTRTGSFLFPVATGELAADGTGTVRYAGAVRFRQGGHGIDMEFSDFEFVFDGTDRPRVTARFVDRNGDGAGAPAPGTGTDACAATTERIDFGRLELAEVTPKAEADGAVRLLPRAAVTLSCVAAKPFLFYKEGEAFGAMSVRAAIAPAAPAPDPADPDTAPDATPAP